MEKIVVIEEREGVMEMPLAEIELDLAQSIKRRQIVGRTGERGGVRKERDHLGKEEGGGIDHISRGT